MLVPASRQGRAWGELSAALREVREEAGIDVRLTGLVRLEQSVIENGVRLRAVFVAEPVSDSPLKSTADEHTLRANWVRIEELGRYPLRGGEVEELFAYLAAGGPTYPVDTLTPEGAVYLSLT